MSFNDALESKIDEALDIVESRNIDVPSPAPEEPASPIEAPPPPVDKVAEAKEVEILEAKQHANPARRDKSGKFQKGADSATTAKQISDQVANPDNTAQLTGQPDTASSQLPEFWPAEMKKAAGAAPKEFIELVKRHDEQRENLLRSRTAEAQRAKTFEARMYEGMQPEEVTRHRAELAVNGLKDEVDELHRYRAYDKLIRSDVRGYAAHLLQINGIHPNELLESAQDPVSAQYDPNEIVRRAEEAAQAKIDNWNKEQDSQRIAQEVEAFKSGKDSVGQQRKPFFEAYEPQIAMAISAIKQQYPQLTRNDVIHHAYEFVMGEVRKMHGIAGAPAAAVATPTGKTNEQRIADAQKAKAASGKVSGSSVNGIVPERSKLKGKNFSEKLDNAINQTLDGAGVN